ncbi:helix-turn-helix domain-containing protein [Thermomonas brevis]
MRDLSPQVLSEWDEFTTDHLKEKEQAAFHARKNAIIAVARGMSMASAAKKYGVNAKTLSETIRRPPAFSSGSI